MIRKFEWLSIQTIKTYSPSNMTTYHSNIGCSTLTISQITHWQSSCKNDIEMKLISEFGKLTISSSLYNKVYDSFVVKSNSTNLFDQLIVSRIVSWGNQLQIMHIIIFQVQKQSRDEKVRGYEDHISQGNSANQLQQSMMNNQSVLECPQQ